MKNPTQRCVNIMAAADTGGAGGTLIVKASRELSCYNNRLYRQGMSYPLRFSLNTGYLDNGATITYQFFTLPNTWFVHGAIKYAYKIYMQAHEDEIRAGVKFGRWHDFTIDEQNPDGTWELSQATMFDGDAWAGMSGTQNEAPVDTQITLNDGSTTKLFRLMGTDSAAFNIFQEYANLLKYRSPTTSAVSSSQPYDSVLDLKDADLMAEVGDRPPYDKDFSTFLDDGSDDQNILVQVAELTFDSNAMTTRTITPYFDAPLGLVYVLKSSDNSANDVSNSVPELCMHVRAGNYKGTGAVSLTG